MKPKTLNLILKACLIGIVLDLPLVHFNMILGASIMIILTALLLFSGWEAWKLIRTNPNAFKASSEREKELSLKDLPSRLLILLIALIILASLGYFSFFSFNPLIDIILGMVTLLLLVYYFFQTHKLRKKV
jgi:L-asparagine transporter-like permease